jgi:hypothetical protein
MFFDIWYDYIIKGSALRMTFTCTENTSHINHIQISMPEAKIDVEFPVSLRFKA